MLSPRLRLSLIDVAKQGQPITYQALARRLELLPPQTIQQLTSALETLMEEDALAGRPLIAALVVGKGTQVLPRQGFFECAQRVGCFQGDPLASQAHVFHKAEFERAVEFWSAFPLSHQGDL